MNLIFGVVKIIHMAYGQCVMLGLYFIYTLVTHLGPRFSGLHRHPALMGVVGFGLQALVDQPFSAKANPDPTPGPGRS
jgi:branched-subunit amino acid ABC-type transport system permease component